MSNSDVTGIIRSKHYAVAEIDNGFSISNPIDMTRYVGGMIYVPASVTGHIAFYHSTYSLGTFYQVYDKDLTALGFDASSISGWVTLPAELMAVQWLQIRTFTTSAYTTPQNQSADKKFDFSLVA